MDTINLLTISSTELAWRSLTDPFTRIQHTAFTTCFITTVAYALPALVYFAIQFVPFMNKYKIQQNVHVPVTTQLYSYLSVFVNTSILVWVPAWLAYCVPQLHPLLNGFELAWERMPSWATFPVRSYAAIAAADLWIYIYHRAFSHHPKLYKLIHKKHHEYPAPFGIANNYADLVEIFAHAIGVAMASSLVFSHFAQVWAHSFVLTWHSISTHSGYQCWWIHPVGLLPGLTSPAEHDIHHEKSAGNFAPSFILWDHLFGTYVLPRVDRLGYPVRSNVVPDQKMK